MSNHFLPGITGLLDLGWSNLSLTKLSESPSKLRGCTRGVMVKAMDCGIVVTRVRTPVALLRLLSDKYPWERYEPPYPPSYGLNSTTTVLLEGWLWHEITYKG